MKDKYQLETVASSIIDAANGSIGRAEELKDKQELYEAINKVANHIENSSLIETLKNADIIYKSQEDKYEILEYMNILFYRKSKEDMKYLNCIKIIEETKKRLKANSNYNMSIDNMIMTIWEEIH